LVVLGVAQEQHAERCALFAQWHRIDWPILHDPINLMQTRGVPIVVGIDEHGVTRALRLRPENLEERFVGKSYAEPGGGIADVASPTPDIAVLAATAKVEDTARAWRRLGNAMVLWGGTSRVNEAIAAYSRATRIDPKDGDGFFRLGAALRIRYEAKQGRPDDFQAAVDSWFRATTLNPNQYIWRRRIEQYGPRLSKPYPFYDWVTDAATQIRARGEIPVKLTVEPDGSELAQPARRFETAAQAAREPDPNGRVHRDGSRLVQIKVTVVPSKVKPGRPARVHVTCRPSAEREAHWNNETSPLRLWVIPPAGWQTSRRLLTCPNPERPTSDETRRFDFEVEAPKGAKGKAKLTAYALYAVCEDVRGSCQYLRQDVSIYIPVHE